MQWIPWAIGGAGVIVTIIIAIASNGRATHKAIHKRIDKTRDDCNKSFCDKEVFVDFRKETRKGFETLNTKVDGIPLQVKELLKPGG